MQIALRIKVLQRLDCGDCRIHAAPGPARRDQDRPVHYSAGRWRTREIDPRVPGKFSVSLVLRTGTDRLAVPRDTLNNSPILAIAETSDDPPKLINGSGTPINGTTEAITAM